MKKQMNIQLPKDIAALPENDRQKILAVIAQAMRLPSVIKANPASDEHNVWAPNEEPLMADLEDSLYEVLSEASKRSIADIIATLDLDIKNVKLEKSFSEEQLEYDRLIKANKGSKSKLSDMVRLSLKKRTAFLKYLEDMNPFSKKQLKRLDDILKQNIPDILKLSEDFMTRAGFTAKIRSKAEQEGLDLMGAFVDRYPSTIKAARKEGLVLTVKDQERKAREGKKVKILPLTPLEAKAVQQAEASCSNKIAEVSERHRSGIKQLVIRAQKERWSAQKLAQELFNTYGDQNRDWRRVAITELAMAANDAYLLSIEEGETVYVPPVAGACKHCVRLLEGKSFTVTNGPPKKATYSSEEKYVWAGKSNYGRKVSEWVPCIPLHPHCRHRYHKITRFYKLDNGKPALKTTAELINEERVKRGMKPDPNLI